MSEHMESLLPTFSAPVNGQPRHSTGILPYQTIKALVRSGQISATEQFTEDQYQPASLDLRLGSTAYRVRASFLPGPSCTVKQKIREYCTHEIDLRSGAVLEKTGVYVVPLMEHVSLPKMISGLANPKSSTGRLDIFTRVIANYSTEFERVKGGYRGPLYVEVSPRSFSIKLQTGLSLNQLRLRRGSPSTTDTLMRRLQSEVGLVDKEVDSKDISSTGMAFSVDLTGDENSNVVGYAAKRHAGIIDLSKIRHYDPVDYWDEILVPKKGGIILDPNEFYLLVSKESVTVPPDHAAEMVAYDTLVGEFRVHYAGFFDPGFGHVATSGSKARAVLEVRSHDVPFLLEDGQYVGRLMYERLTDTPDRLYGAEKGSSYQGQGLMLSKHFKQPVP